MLMPIVRKIKEDYDKISNILLKKNPYSKE